MRLKKVQRWLHENYETIRNYLLIAIGIMLLASSMIMISAQNRLINQVKQLAEQNQQLSKENQALAKETQGVVKQNRTYTKCIATIFAQYTHDFIPITIINLDSCALDSRLNNAATPYPQAFSQSSEETQPTQPSQPTQPAQPTTSKQPDKPSVIDRVTKTVDNVLRRVGL